MDDFLIEPKFKKTPKERKKEKAFGAEPTDLGLPMMGLISMGATAASSAAYDKAQKLNNQYKNKKGSEMKNEKVKMNASKKFMKEKMGVK